MHINACMLSRLCLDSLISTIYTLESLIVEPEKLEASAVPC